MHKTLTFLSQIKHHLAYIDYDTIYQSILDLDHKIIPTSLLNEGHFIERARINYGGEIFTNPGELTYISDPDILRDKVKYGRANLPQQAVFYGSIISPEIRLPRGVAYFETSTRVKELIVPGPFEEIFTVSRWQILETVQLAEIIYAEQYPESSRYVRTSIHNQRAHLEQAIERFKREEGLDYTQHFQEQSSFFCNEFATQIDSSDDYKISAAYANYIFDRTPAEGLTYPSVQSGYQGQNVAMLPSVADRILRLREVYMCKCVRGESGNPVVSITQKVSNIGDNAPFQWVHA